MTRTVSKRFAWAVYAVLVAGFAAYAGTEVGSFTAPLNATLGGTGFNGSSAGNGYMPIGNGSGFSLALIAGTSNQIVVTPGSGTLALSTPQDIGTGSAVTFATVATKLTVSAKTTSYSVQSSDTNTAFTNTGASGTITFTLPTAAAGLIYRFEVDAVQTLQITAGASTTIQVGGSTSSAAGTISAAAKGASITLFATDTTHWFATGYTGTWTTS